jgi:hypothetical protein
MIKNTRQNSIAFNCLTALFVLSAFFTSGLLQATGHKRESQSHLLAVNADEPQSLLDNRYLSPQKECTSLLPQQECRGAVSYVQWMLALQASALESLLKFHAPAQESLLEFQASALESLLKFQASAQKSALEFQASVLEFYAQTCRRLLQLIC